MTQEALKLALEALEANDQLINGTGTNGGLVYCMDGYYSDCFDVDPINKQTEEAIAAIKEALAQPEQEPVKMVAYNCTCGRTMKFESVHGVVAPQRTWVGLTDDEMTHAKHHMVEGAYQYSFKQGALWAEAKLKEKNT